MTKEQQIYAALSEIADKAYAGLMSDSDIKAECNHINQKFNIDNAYKRSEAIYKRLHESHTGE